MVLMDRCFTTLLILQCTQILNAAYLVNRKEELNYDNFKKGTKKTYYNPWTPTHLSIVKTPTNYQFPQPQPQNSRVIYVQTQGTFPLYFPPKLIYFNIGHPADNPPRNYSPKRNTTTVSTLNRFGDEDDGPVWDTIEGTTPSLRRGPTRRSKVHFQTFPPVIRHESTTPRSKIIAESLFTINSNLDEVKTVTRNNKNPSRCVWAIISCCSTTTSISYQCFEHLGCVGAFWDSSPCESDFAHAAVTNIMNYYQSK